MTEQEDRQRLAEAVRAERVHRGWSKEKAAEAAGISSITWKRVEDGLRVQETKVTAMEKALDWEPGSMDAVLRGGQPRRQGVPLPIREPTHRASLFEVAQPRDLIEAEAMIKALTERILRAHEESAVARLAATEARYRADESEERLTHLQFQLALLEKRRADLLAAQDEEESEHSGDTAPTTQADVDLAARAGTSQYLRDRAAYDEMTEAPDDPGPDYGA